MDGFKYFLLHIFDDFQSGTQLPKLRELWGQYYAHCSPYNRLKAMLTLIKILPIDKQWRTEILHWRK